MNNTYFEHLDKSGNVNGFVKDFSSIAAKIEEIANTENTYAVKSAEDLVCDVSRYTEHGLNTLGRTLGFPAPFLKELHDTSPELANTVVKDRAEHHFASKNPHFFAREFMGDICGCVSNQFEYFDDKQVAEIINASPLASKRYAHALVTPERLHLRAIDEDPFRLNGDESDLYFCYFIDNSMVGLAAFSVRIGIYRKVCSNGLIMPVKDFEICKQIHRGDKDIVAEFNQSIAFIEEKKEDIKKTLKKLTTANAAVMDMKEEHRIDFIARALTLSKKESRQVMELFTETYGGKTKWDMVNAITEFARDVKTIERREFLEKKAILVA